MNPVEDPMTFGGVGAGLTSGLKVFLRQAREKIAHHEERERREGKELGEREEDRSHSGGKIMTWMS
jgi:hypothetical protein